MKRLLFFLLLFPLFFTKAWAEEPVAGAMALFDSAQMENGLSGEEREIVGEIGPNQKDVSSALSRLFGAVLERLNTELRSSLSFGTSLLSLVFLSGFACSACKGEKSCEMIELCAISVAAVFLIGNVNSLISQTVEALFRLSDYSKAALPVVFTAAAASGGVSSAAAGCAGACLALDVLMSLSQRFIIPLIYAFLCMSLTNVVFPHPLLAAVIRVCKWAAKTTLTASTLAFTAYLGMSTLIGKSVDAAAVKTARTVISTSLPVVGGMLSDASSAVLSAASVVLSCTGVFGLIAVSAMCLGPFVVLSVRGFVFRAVAAVAEAAQSPHFEKLFAGIGDAVGLLMGMLGCCAIMLFLAFAAAMRAVTA
jgi:stage III sporulation protein AE